MGSSRGGLDWPGRLGAMFYVSRVARFDGVERA
jgi:hypothetical protein